MPVEQRRNMIDESDTVSIARQCDLLDLKHKTSSEYLLISIFLINPMIAKTPSLNPGYCAVSYLS